MPIVRPRRSPFHAMRRALVALATVVVTVLFAGGGVALACGGLVAANGSVQLLRTTTLAGYVDGVEHYVTSFEFASPEESFGSIVPLPGEPDIVERAGDWTLQRLRQEVGIDGRDELFAAAADGAAESARNVEVLQEVRIDSLDVTIVKGGGAEVAEWASEQGFELSDDAPETLEFYAERSPYFMAARFDGAAAADDGFVQGDGIPVHLAIPVERPWVPLHILALGKAGSEVVEADVFLLTPDRPTLAGDDVLDLNVSEPASDRLLDDLRSDDNSDWVPESAWLTHLVVDRPAEQLTGDLAISVDGSTPPAADVGVSNGELAGDIGVGADPGEREGRAGLIAAFVIIGLGIVALPAGVIGARRIPRD